MPHCIIEYSAALAEELEIGQLVDRVHHATLASGLFAEKDIKIRAIAYPHSRNGLTGRAQVATTVKLLPGRAAAQKERLGTGVLAALQTFLGDSSVEIVDLSPAYFK